MYSTSSTNSSKVANKGMKRHIEMVAPLLDYHRFHRYQRF